MSPEELIEQATGKESFMVRRDAFIAMGTRRDISPFVKTLTSALYEEIEGSPAVRKEAIRTIGNRPDIIKHEPYIIEMLEWVKDNDSSEFVREEAQDALLTFCSPKEISLGRHAKTELTALEKAAISMNIGAPFGKATFTSVIAPDKKHCWEKSKQHPLYGASWVIKGAPPEKPTVAVNEDEKDETTVMYSSWMPPDVDFEP